jgi:hypothetical protein
MNTPIIAIDKEGENVIITVSGEVNRIVKKWGPKSSGWDQGYLQRSERQFATYKMYVMDFGNYPMEPEEFLSGKWRIFPENYYDFEVARDAWMGNNRSTERYGKNNEIPPNVYEISFRGYETIPTKGAVNEWLGVNDIGLLGGTIISGPDGKRIGISIHPGNPNYSKGCLTMSLKDFKIFRQIVLNAINNGQKVYLILYGRRAKYNQKLHRWEWDDEVENEN